MAQFDVYANPSKTQYGEIPWMADIQSEILDEVPTRLVMRSALRANMPAAMPQSLCTTIHRLGRSDPGGFAASGLTVRVKDLGPVQGSLRSQARDFVAAVDAVTSGNLNRAVQYVALYRRCGCKERRYPTIPRRWHVQCVGPAAAAVVNA